MARLPPRFHTDDDRTVFEVELFIHPAFETKLPFVPEGNVAPTLDSIDAVLDQLLNYCGFNPAVATRSAIAGIQAGTIAEELKSIDNQANEAIASVDSIQAGTIAAALEGAIAENEQKILARASEPADRELLLTHIGVTNQRKNYESYMLPMVNKGWLTMTIPDKPTSPNQKYITTLKGRMVLEILKRNKK